MMGCTIGNVWRGRPVIERFRLRGWIASWKITPGGETTKRDRRRNFVDDAGAALIEFAVSAAVLFMVLFGIIQVCYALYVYNYVSDAARVATRYAIVRGSACTGMPDCNATQAQIQSYLRGIPYPGINSSILNANVTWFQVSTTPTTWTACASQCNAPQNAVQVQVTYPFPLHIPYWKSATVNVASTSQMVISN